MSLWAKVIDPCQLSDITAQDIIFNVSSVSRLKLSVQQERGQYPKFYALVPKLYVILSNFDWLVQN